MKYQNTLSFARKLDRQDPLRRFRTEFHIPKTGKRQAVYMTGNSLGLQPKGVKKLLLEELEDWASLGVEGHLHARRPWLSYHRQTKSVLAKLTGASMDEVVAMGQLTANLHLMLVSFYRPTSKRFKIVMEAGAFPSDRYAVASHLRYHGLEPADTIIEVAPNDNRFTIDTEDFIARIRENHDSIALILLGAVQYYSGQFFAIRKITEAAHACGALIGLDLAHAIGNVPLSLHRDGVDFAVWCSYKYLNSGPGGIAGIYIHAKHHDDPDIPRFNGWWGHRESDRFAMPSDFVPARGVDAWQVSNVPIFQAAAHLAALRVFAKTRSASLRRKSIMLTGFLEHLLRQIDPLEQEFRIITPASSNDRGCQLSVLFKKNGKRVFKTLLEHGIMADWREPDVIRLAPVPLYNSFEDVYRVGSAMKKAVQKPLQNPAK